MQYRSLFVVALITYGSAFLLTACKKDAKAPANSTPTPDQTLFAEATAPSGFIWYRGGDTIVAAVPASPHLKYRLRFNAIAASSLDGAENLPAGRSFAPGALVVKDVYDHGQLVRVNVMKKDLVGPNAAAGWQWAEYNPNGSLRAGVTARGAACISCHSITPNRDLTRTFDLH